jgi:hypothetical protein
LPTWRSFCVGQCPQSHASRASINQCYPHKPDSAWASLWLLCQRVESTRDFFNNRKKVHGKKLPAKLFVDAMKIDIFSQLLGLVTP